MPEFDPRLSPTRHAPAVLGCAAVLLAAFGGIGLTRLTQPLAAPIALAELQPAATPAGAAVSLLGGAIDAAHTRAGAALRPSAPAPVVAPSPRPVALAVREERTVAAGVMRGSLYESALRVGATPTLVSQAVRLFGRSLDFSRDIQPGDPFRLVFDRKVAADGRTVETGDLLYAEVGAKGRTARFYRFEHGGKVEYADAVGQASKPLLLKTPLEGAHLTSSFGMRLHPLLRFHRLHPGVDFGAASGTPVFAAGDGVVQQAGWRGGYGRWLKLRHEKGFETGYGHLARFAPGVRPGSHVRQGQVVAYVGSTGLSTGPHLHYEVIRAGRQVDPHGAKLPKAQFADATALAAFREQKARIDALLARPGDGALRMASAGAGPVLR